MEEEKAQSLLRSVREDLPTGRKVLSEREIGEKRGCIPYSGGDREGWNIGLAGSSQWGTLPKNPWPLP